MSLKISKSFARIMERYRIILFDAYGVLKNSSGIIEGVPDVLARLKSNGNDFYVITNDASRSPEKMAETYVHRKLGHLVPSERIISSGMLAREFLQAKVKKSKYRIAYLGKPPAAHYIESAGLTPVPISEVKDGEMLGAIVFMDDEGFDWFRDLNRVLNILREQNIPVLVANSDRAYPVKANQVAIAVGSLASMVENIVKKTFIRFGKPDTQIFSYAMSRIRGEHTDIARKDLLMVGDTLGTDILGANKYGIDSALVLSGNTARDKVNLQVQSTGIIPTFVLDSIMT